MPFFLNRKTEEISEFDLAINKQLLNENQIQLSATSLSEAKKQAEPYIFAKKSFDPAQQFQTPSGLTVTAAGVTVPSVITADDLTPRVPFTPATLSIPKPPTLSFEETPKERELEGMGEGLKGLYAELAEKPQFEQLQKEQAGIEAKTQVFESLSRQIRDIAKQQELVPLTIERQSVGRGRTEGGVFPLQMGLRRTLAYDGLILASRLDAARGDLDIAERKVKTAVDTKFAPIEAAIARDEKNYALIKNSPSTTRQEKQRALEKEIELKKYEEEVKAFKEKQKAILDMVNKAATNLAKTGQLTPETEEELRLIARDETTELGALNRLSPYLKETTKETLEVAMKVAEQGGKPEQVEYIRKSRDGAEAARRAIEMGFVVAKVEKVTGQSDFEQAFLRDTGRLPTVAELLEYKRKERAARREPKGKELLPSAGFFDPKIESSVREDFVALTGRYKNPIAPTEDEKAQTFKTLRNLYSPQEANDDALRSLIGITPPSEIPPADQTTQQAALSWLGGLFKGGFTAGVKRIFGESEERIRFDKLDWRFIRGETLTESEMEEYRAALKKFKK